MAFILDDILLSPLKFTIWLGEKVRDTALQEMTDEDSVQEELLHLQMQYEMGEIEEREFDKREAELMGRMEKIKTLKEQMESERR
jgi:hypothetical protein